MPNSIYTVKQRTRSYFIDSAGNKVDFYVTPGHRLTLMGCAPAAEPTFENPLELEEIGGPNIYVFITSVNLVLVEGTEGVKID